MSEPIVVTGIHTGIPPGAKRSDYPARLEWTEFAKNDYFVFLFAHALKKMQEEEQVVGLPLSFFQVGGTPSRTHNRIPPTAGSCTNEADG